jgi:hypothetical protein
MKITKKILSMLLVLCMVLSMCPSMVFATESATEATSTGPVTVPVSGTSVFKGIPENAVVNYLSDTSYVVKTDNAKTLHKDAFAPATGATANTTHTIYVWNAAGNKRVSVVKTTAYDGRTDTGIRTIDGREYHWDDIVLGKGIVFEKGLVTHLPKAVPLSQPEGFVYKVTGDRFYAVAGGIGDATTKAEKTYPVDFLVYGTKDADPSSANYELIASATEVYHYKTAEFDIDVSGYNYIKIATQKSAAATAEASTYYLGWGDAAFYTPVKDYASAKDGELLYAADFNKINFNVTSNKTFSDAPI